MRSPANKPDRALAAIAVGVLWAIANPNANVPDVDRLALLVGGVALGALAVASRLPPALVAVYAVLIAVAERIHGVPRDDYSDVLRATGEAITVFLAGENPYAHTMLTTNPVGSPFFYPPGEFLFYLPAYLVGDIRWIDLAAGVVITAAIALAGIRAGFGQVALPAMLYATWPYGSLHAADGSNDTAAALLVVLAVVLLALHEVRPSRALFIVSAICFGWAIAFKQFGLLFLFPVVAALAAERRAGRPWRAYTTLSLGTTAAFILPFLIRDPGAFIGQQIAGLTFHKERTGLNLQLGLEQLGVDLPPPVGPLALVLVVGGLLVVCLARRRGGLGRATLYGTFVMITALLLTGWTSESYWLYAGATGLLGIGLLEERVADR